MGDFIVQILVVKIHRTAFVNGVIVSVLVVALVGRFFAWQLTPQATVVYTSVMKTLISIKTDAAVKRGVQKMAAEFGIPLSTLVNAHFKQLLRDRRVAFALPLRPNKKTAALIRRAREDYRNGKNVSPLFDNAEDAIAYLHK